MRNQRGCPYRCINLPIDNLLRVDSSAEQAQYKNTVSKHCDVEIEAIEH